MNITALGNQTRTLILQEEAHKLTVELECAGAVKKGMPVKLTATGTITPWAKTDLQHLCIGYAYGDAAIGELCTIWTRGYMLVNALSHAAASAGPGAYESTVTSGANTGYTKWSGAADATTIGGWILDQATGADQPIRVLLKN